VINCNVDKAGRQHITESLGPMERYARAPLGDDQWVGQNGPVFPWSQVKEVLAELGRGLRWHQSIGKILNKAVYWLQVRSNI
jgi:hypothetical protein